MLARRLALLLALSACTSPEPAYYTLAPIAGPPHPQGTGRIKLRRIGLAGYLDRPQIVRTGDPYRLNLAAGERWGEPLGDMIGRVLAEDLGQRLPGRLVFSAAGALTVDAEVAVAIDVQRFDTDSSDVVTLLAEVATEPEHGQGISRTVHLTAPAGGGSTPALVAAMSFVLGELADAIAAMLG